MTSLDQELDIGIHEWGCHGDGRAIRKDELGVLTESLDDAENVVPSSAIKTRRVVSQLVDDLNMSQPVVSELL